MQISVSMFTFRCIKCDTIRNEVQIGLDVDNDIWISYICSNCGMEVMQCVKMEDLVLKAAHHTLNTEDLKWLHEMSISGEDNARVDN